MTALRFLVPPAMIAACLMLPGSASAQISTDSLSKPDADSSARAGRSLRDTGEAHDPLRYRLFAMATGETLERGDVVLCVHELAVASMAAAPLDWLQVQGIAAPLGRPVWAVGVKVPVVRNVSFIRGIAVGIDASSGLFRTSVSPSYAVSATLGSDRVAVHCTAMADLAPMPRELGYLPSVLQLGASLSPRGSAATVMAEAWLDRDVGSGFRTDATFFGLRVGRAHFIWEAGLMVIYDFDVTGHGSGTLPLPYVSGAWNF